MIVRTFAVLLIAILSFNLADDYEERPHVQQSHKVAVKAF